MPANQFFLGRQPIVGRDQELVAYELLFRSNLENQATIFDDVAASTAVIKHTFSDLGVDQALGDKSGYINISEGLLSSDVIEALPKDRVVLEILETVGLTDDIIARCKYLSEAGFRLALDDIVGLDDRQRAVLPHIAIIKVDRQHLSNEDLAGLVQKYAPYSLTLLAEKVETQDQYQYCRSLGFSLFQGYFFAKPTIITGRSLQPSTTMLLKLFCLTARDTELDDLEDAVKQVPEVALALLRTANSVAFGVTGKVTSVRRAIFLVGRIQLNRMVQILMFAMNSNTTATANPLLQCAAVRGRLMEGLAVTTGRPDLKDRAFIAGMLSLIDVLFQQPMSEIIEQLNLDELTQDALLNRRGELGALLRLVEAIEQSEQEPVLRVIEKLVMTDAAKLNQLHVDALRWANTL